ncbi:hypothetical protein BLO02_024675 [Bacillus cereus]|nr:hypothetical protein [Bacillus cereus]RCL13789.1 hypothetical protein BLO02_024675 [Bacillus cereus]
MKYIPEGVFTEEDKTIVNENIGKHSYEFDFGKFRLSCLNSLEYLVLVQQQQRRGQNKLKL